MFPVKLPLFVPVTNCAMPNRDMPVRKVFIGLTVFKEQSPFVGLKVIE
jgi:hypothetical protein